MGFNLVFKGLNYSRL